MTDIQEFFAVPADLNAKYDFLSDDSINAQVTLSKAQQALVLGLHDYGLEVINDDNKHLLYSIIADLKAHII